MPDITNPTAHNMRLSRVITILLGMIVLSGIMSLLAIAGVYATAFSVIPVHIGSGFGLSDPYIRWLFFISTIAGTACPIAIMSALWMSFQGMRYGINWRHIGQIGGLILAYFLCAPFFVFGGELLASSLATSHSAFLGNIDVYPMTGASSTLSALIQVCITPYFIYPPSIVIIGLLAVITTGLGLIGGKFMLPRTTLLQGSAVRKIRYDLLMIFAISCLATGLLTFLNTINLLMAEQAIRFPLVSLLRLFAPGGTIGIIFFIFLVRQRTQFPPPPPLPEHLATPDSTTHDNAEGTTFTIEKLS